MSSACQVRPCTYPDFGGRYVWRLDGSGKLWRYQQWQEFSISPEGIRLYKWVLNDAKLRGATTIEAQSQYWVHTCTIDTFERYATDVCILDIHGPTLVVPLDRWCAKHRAGTDSDKSKW